MFKRVEKRLKRREEEIKLGIDDDMRDVLGLNDTDSEESESDSGLSNDAFDGEDEGSEDEGEGDEAWGGIGGSELGDASEEDEEEEEEAGPRHIAFPVITAQQALDDPIYAHPTQDNAHLCSICPGRTLISTQTISQHRASKAHKRRSKHIAELASLPENADSSLSDLMQLLEGRPRPGSHPQGQPEGEDAYASKRAEKKRKASEIRKAKREKLKAKKMERRKAEEEQDAREDTEKAVMAKDNIKRKAESSSKATAQPTASKKKTELIVQHPPTMISNKRQKKGTEKDKEGAPAKTKRKTGETGVRSEQEKSVATTEDRHKAHVTAKKKRKAEETGVPSEQEIAEKIKELTKSIGTTEDSHAPAKKKRKMGETDVKELTKSVTPEDSSSKKKRQPRTNEGEQQVTQKIQHIAKSATKRARLAQSKANGQGKKKVV